MAVALDVAVAVAVAETVVAQFPTRRHSDVNTPMLNHEKLDCYQIAVELLGLFARIAEGFPRGYGALGDQLRRASLSVPLNIAEGYGKRSIADRSRFYDIARGSAHECGAIMDAGRKLGFITQPDFSRTKELLVRVVSMLVKMTA